MYKVIKFIGVFILGLLLSGSVNAQTDTKALKVYQMPKGAASGNQKDSVVLWRKSDSLFRSISVDSFQLINTGKVLTLTDVSGTYTPSGEVGVVSNAVKKIKYTGSNGGLLKGLSVASHSGNLGDVSGLTAVISQQYLNKDTGELIVQIIGKPENDGIAKFYFNIDTVQYVLDYPIISPVIVDAYWKLVGNGSIDPSSQYLGTQDYTPLVFKTNGTFAMKLTESGKLGLGAEVPSAHLHVKNISGSNNIFKATNDADIDAFTILNNGLIGVGKSNPFYKFDVAGKGKFSDSLISSNLQLTAISAGSATDSIVTIDDNGILRKRNTSVFKTDTTSLSNRINLKLNSSDTAAMLLPYAKNSAVVKYADTTSMLANYANAVTNGLSKTGKVISLGGALTAATTLTTSAGNTLAIAGLQSGAAADSLVTVDASGVLRRRSVLAAVSEPWYKVGTTIGATNNTDNVYLNGNVGIGTNTPNNKLEITHGTAGNSGLRFTNLTSASTPSLGSNFLSLDASGNVIYSTPGSIFPLISANGSYSATTDVRDYNVWARRGNAYYLTDIGGSIANPIPNNGAYLALSHVAKVSKYFSQTTINDQGFWYRGGDTATISSNNWNKILSVNANSKFNISWEGAATNSIAINNVDSGSIKFYTNNYERMKLLPVGNVAIWGNLGLGTETPAGKLNLYGATPLTGYSSITNAERTGEISFSAGGAYSGLASIQGLDYNLYNGGIAFNVSTGSNFPTTSVTPMVIKGSNVGIGSLSPAYPLHLSTSSDVSLYIESNPADVNGMVVLNAKPTGGFTNNQEYLVFKANGTAIGSVKSTNTGTTVAYESTSDQRLKENIVNTSFTIQDLMKIEIKDYNFKADSSKSKLTGVLAQQLYAIAPGVVSVGGEDPKINPWTVDYSKLTPFLIKSVQDQQHQIEQLNTQKDTLLNLINKLEERIKLLENK